MVQDNTVLRQLDELRVDGWVLVLVHNGVGRLVGKVFISIVSREVVVVVPYGLVQLSRPSPHLRSTAGYSHTSSHNTTPPARICHPRRGLPPATATTTVTSTSTLTSTSTATSPPTSILTLDNALLEVLSLPACRRLPDSGNHTVFCCLHLHLHTTNLGRAA